jgi:lipopolysaccharide export system permease protein
MKILSRYILRQFFSIFGLALAAFVGLYLIIDFFEKVDSLIKNKVPAATTGLYFLYKTPLIVAQGIPMAVLLATLISLGILKRNREIVAMRAAGLNAAVYSQPIALAALLIAFVHFGAGETLARTLNQKAQNIWQHQVLHQKSSISWTQENVWYHGQNCIYQIRLYDRHTQAFHKVSLFYLDEKFKLVQRLDSTRITWDSGHWTAQDGLVLRFNGNDTEQEWFKERKLDLPETPKDFSSLQTIPEQLGWIDLYRYAKKIRQEGYNSAPYEVELNLRLAFPLTTLILAFMGITMSLRQELHSGIAVGVIVALLVAFLYLTLLNVGCSMATAGLLPPIVGAWAANIIFASLSYYLWITNDQ